MNIKIFTQKNLDGIGCSILAAIASGREHISVSYCDYSNIDEEVTEFISDKMYLLFEKIYIAGISISSKLAEVVNSNSILKNKLTLLDFSLANLELNQYNWADIIAFKNDRRTCGASLIYDHLANSKLIEKSGRLDKFADTIRAYQNAEYINTDDFLPKKLNDLFYIQGTEIFFTTYYERLMDLSVPFGILSESDKDILSISNEVAKNYIKDKEIFKMPFVIGGRTYDVALVFAENYIDELGNYICNNNPKLDFVAIVTDLRSITLKTIKDKIDFKIDVLPYFEGVGSSKHAEIKINDKIRMDIINIILK